MQGDEAYRAEFHVREFSVEEIAVAFETKPEAVYRGDRIEGAVRLRYSWGATLADEPVTLTMPDGRKLSGKTDANGLFAFAQETTGFQPGQFVSFSANLPARNRTAAHSVSILKAGTTLVWERVPSPALVGEPAILRVKALSHIGKPIATAVKLTISRKPEQKPNDVLSGLPGLRYIPSAAAPSRVEELTIQTDPATGIAEARPILKDAATHLVSAHATDARGNAVEITTDMAVSGADDAQKLLLFTDNDELIDGAAIRVDAHSRIAAPLALVTLAGESMIEHRVVPLAAGHNEFAIAVGGAHWPQFDVSVVCLDGDRLHRVRRGFVVKRPLKIEIETPAQPPKPGAETAITLTVTDGQGKPAVAELSLALASAQLFAQFPDGCTGIGDFFAMNLRTRGSVRSTSSAAFQHRAQSRLLKRDEAGNAAAIAEATESHVEHVRNLEAMEQRTWAEQGGRMRVQSAEYAEGLNLNTRIRGTNGYATMDFEAPQLPQTFGGIDNAGGVSIEEGAKPFAPHAQWHCPIVTGADGKATITLPPLRVAGEWRLMSKGCTKSTSVGQAQKTMLTKFDASLELAAPSFGRPGDTFQPQITLFGPPGRPAAAKVELEFRAHRSGEETTPDPVSKQSREITPAADGVGTARFNPIVVPVPGDTSSLTYWASIGNWDVTRFSPFEVLAPNDVALRHAATLLEAAGALNLPAQERQAVLFTLHVSPLALLSVMGHGGHDQLDRQPRTPQTPASQLLSAVSALRAVRAAGQDESELAARVKLLVATLQITQRDGGWTWQSVTWDRDSVVSSMGLWALVEARALGFAVEDAAVNKTATYLKGALAIIPPDEPEKAAVILHALAMVNQADFSVANRLLRDRAKLNDPALAYLAAAFLRMERSQEAQELLKALEARAEWAGSKSTARLSRADDTAAMILYVAARAQAGSPLAKRAAQALLPNLGVACGADSPLRGLWTAALAEHFIGAGMHRLAPAVKVSVSVNGKAVPGFAATPHKAYSVRGPAANGAQRMEIAFADGGRPILLSTAIVPLAKAAAETEALPTIVKREWLHTGFRHRDLPLKARSTSPVGVAEFGQRIRVRLALKPPQKPQTGYVIVDEPLPAGCLLIADTLSAPHARLEELPGKLRLWFTPGTFAEGKENEISYDLVALHPGAYGIPPTIVSDACRPERRTSGAAGKLSILLPGQPGPEPYQMNRDERLELAKLLFDEGKLEEARTHLEILRADTVAMKANEREVARMLLWAQTARNPMDSKQVVELFETLSERHPDLVIPFDRILKVAEAYRQIGEFERSWLVHRATMESAFVRDAGVSAALESGGDFPGSVEHQLALWREYPDAPDISLAFFRLAQSLEEKSSEPAAVPMRPGAVKLTKTQLLERSRDLLRSFVILRAKDDLADDASFSLANVYFDLKDYASVVKTAGIAAAAYPKSPFANSFHYMTALGRFWQYQFPEALAAAAPVAAGTSDDAPNARYITAQIYHAQERHAEAIQWYEKVRDEFEDAAESIRALQEKGVKLPPATNARPGEAVKLELGYRNVKEAALKIYRVDLLKLHERQKDLSTVSSVNLSGITPEAEITIPLGDGVDYAWKKRAVELPMKQEGAYLVICRGDSQMTSALVLITTLALEVNEEAGSGSVRVQVRDTVRGNYVAEAEIATYDSTAIAQPQKGRTDPRGAFGASDITGHATVVVKLGDARYAYYRSPSTLRPMIAMKAAPNPAMPANAPAPALQKPMSKSDYLMNVKEQNEGNVRFNKDLWEGKMKAEGQGVKAEKAFKK
jgi:tetratricopeptide (TPR) repeat protein